MALTKVDSGSYLTTITDSTTGNKYRISSSANEKRIYNITVTVETASGDSSVSPFAADDKKALHDAIVAVLENTADSTTDTGNVYHKGIGYGT